MHAEHVRIAALCTMHRLFKLSLDYPQRPEQPQQVLDTVITSVGNSMHQERLFNVLCTAAEALSEALRYSAELPVPRVAVVQLGHLPQV
jgi:hypothetical protein